MKKLFKMSAVILFVLIVFSACGRNESVSGKITSFPPYGERVVTAIGDSIAAGYGLDSQEDNYLTLFSDNNFCQIGGFTVKFLPLFHTMLEMVRRFVLFHFRLFVMNIIVLAVYKHNNIGILFN